MNLQKIPYSNHWLFFNHGSQLSQLNDAIPKWGVTGQKWGNSTEFTGSRERVINAELYQEARNRWIPNTDILLHFSASYSKKQLMILKSLRFSSYEAMSKAY